jgi:signal transduction histidine kinase
MTSAGADPRGAWLQEFLQRSYTRLGVSYIHRIVSAAVIVLMLLVWPVTALVGKMLGLTHAEYLQSLVVAEALTVVSSVVGLTLVRAWMRPVLAWLASDPRPAPSRELWEMAIAAPRRLVLTIGTCGLVIAIVPGVIQDALAADLSLWGAIVVLGGALAALAYVAVLTFFAGETLLRPVVRDISERLGSNAPPPPAGVGVAPKTLIGLLAFGFLSGVFSIYLVTDRGAGIDAIGQALLAALFVGTTFSLLVAAAFSETVLGPIRDLLKGTRRVAAGDMSARVPVLSDDEFGQLAQSFNEMVAEVQASKARIVATADEERRRMERDLHDGAQQHLVLLKMKLGMLGDAIDRDPAAAKAQTEELKEDLTRALAELRDLAHGIYPAVLEHEGLPAALRAAVDQAPISGTLHSDGTGRYRPELEAAVYFCCLEALQNAAKHAPESTVTVSLAESDGALRFEIADDGPGFDTSAHNGSAGLQNMADRIGALVGKLTFESRVGSGTVVRGAVPVGS